MEFQNEQGGLGQCLELWMLEKDVWERGEGIMNFSKSEKSTWRISAWLYVFSSSPFFPPFPLFNSVSVSPLSLSWARSLFDSVDFTRVSLLTSAYISAVHCVYSLSSKSLIHPNCTSSCFSLRHYHIYSKALIPSLKGNHDSILKKWRTCRRELHSSCITGFIWLFRSQETSIRFFLF